MRRLVNVVLYCTKVFSQTGRSYISKYPWLNPIQCREILSCTCDAKHIDKSLNRSKCQSRYCAILSILWPRYCSAMGRGWKCDNMHIVKTLDGKRIRATGAVLIYLGAASIDPMSAFDMMCQVVICRDKSSRLVRT